MTARQRRTKGDGGLSQRHDHPTCPPREEVGREDDGRPIMARPAHTCRGRWAGKLVVEVNGRKRVKYIYGRTQKAAKIKLDHAKRLEAEGRTVIGSRTVEWWMTHWLDTIAARRTKPSTLRGYRSKTKTLIVPHLGRYRLEQLQPEHLRTWHDQLRRTGGKNGAPLKEASVRQAHAILRKALTDAVRERKLSYNPCELVDPPSTYTDERERLNVAQARAALRAAGDDPRWWLALFYGMRQGECLGLRWGDVALDDAVPTLTVVQTLQFDDEGKPMFGPPKSRRSQRTLPLRPEIALRLRLARPDDAEPDDLVFAADDGGPRMPWADNRAWHELLDAAGLPSVALHSARNSTADLLEAAGVPDRLAAQILGHSSVKMTHRYTRAELEQMSEGLGSGGALLALDASS